MSGEATGTFECTDRLLDSKDFRRVMRHGSRRASRELVVITSPKRNIYSKFGHLTDKLRVGGSASRLGITASRKVGNAVIRNRFKRRTREWFRRRRSQIPAELDVVVIARKSGARLTFSELDERLSGLLGIKVEQTRGR